MASRLKQYILKRYTFKIYRFKLECTTNAFQKIFISGAKIISITKVITETLAELKLYKK